MNETDFINKVTQVLQPKKVFTNPGRGTSTIISITDTGNIYYRRGGSPLKIAISELSKAYKFFSGKKCTTIDLKEYSPSIFDSKARPAGHSCNCTFLFLMLREMGLASDIKGRWVVGDPFYVDIY